MASQAENQPNPVTILLIDAYLVAINIVCLRQLRKVSTLLWIRIKNTVFLFIHGIPHQDKTGILKGQTGF